MFKAYKLRFAIQNNVIINVIAFATDIWIFDLYLQMTLTPKCDKQLKKWQILDSFESADFLVKQF